ncbi:MAG: methylenetetrahydrofolate reductase [Pseudomonadota bacterium]
MATILPFARKQASAPATGLGHFLEGFSIEVMPRTAAKVEDFKAILPEGTRVYIAHIDGTPYEEMHATAERLVRDGFEVMPHIPARVLPSKTALEEWVAGYADLGIRQALLLGGGLTKPNGPFSDSMQLLDDGVFDRYGFTRLHVAGHPEGNPDIDPDGGEREVMKALRWKQDFADRSDAEFAIATQFCFEAQPVIDWVERLSAAGVTMPVHIGVAGPAKLQTLIKFAMACGVGPSIRVLKRRAMDLSKLVLPFTPDDILRDLAAHKAANPDFGIEAVHFFPLGGIGKTAEYTSGHLGTSANAQTA